MYATHQRVHIDFVDYGLADYIEVDVAFLQYQFMAAVEWLENNLAVRGSQEVQCDIAHDRMNLFLQRLHGAGDSVWIGHCLLNMALWGITGHRLPDWYYLD